MNPKRKNHVSNAANKLFVEYNQLITTKVTIEFQANEAISVATLKLYSKFGLFGDVFNTTM